MMDSTRRVRHKETIVYELYVDDVKEAILLLLKHKYGLDLDKRPGKFILPPEVRLPLEVVFQDETFEEMGYIETAASPRLRSEDGD